jgi:protein TonB
VAKTGGLLAAVPTINGIYRRHGLVLVIILLLHLCAIRAIWMGLANSGVRDLQTIFQVDVIPADKSEKRPLPLPPVNLKQYQAIQIVTPEIKIPVTEDLPPTIQVTSPQKDSSLPPEMAAAPAQPAVPAVPNVRPRPIYVPDGWTRYPAESIRAHETGRPTITICISAAGAIDSVQLTESSGFPRLDQAAVGLGKEARFRPALQGGKPVAFCAPYRITFAIRNS